MKCPKCGEQVRDSERHCPVCQHDCGYPNVRAADRPEEVRALQERVRQAELSAAGRGCASVLAAFQQAVQSSEAVLGRHLSTVMNLVSNDTELYASFYNLVGMGARRPEDTAIELQRLLSDDILFPHYRNEIRFAALSLNGRGGTGYGDCFLVLKETPIQDRATVFEANSVYFCMGHDLGLKRPFVPSGFRTTWDRRDKLATAKLEPVLQPETPATSFPAILLKLGESSQDDDFIEVHIYGSLQRRNISTLTVRKPKPKADSAILKQLEFSLKGIGATVEIYE